MYFDPRVKENAADFFNFAILQEELKAALEDPKIPLIAVGGLRRTGKTSLIRVVLHTTRKRHVWLDGRDIDSREDFYKKLSEEVRQRRRLRIPKISFKGIDLHLETKKDLAFLNQQKMILVIDEAQLLKRLRLDETVAFLYDNYPKIKLVLSGSEAGMLQNFLGKNSAKAPLYGRAVLELQTHRLDPESAHLFLSEGAKQVKKTFSSEETREVITKLDGIIGWLTKYGWYRLHFSRPESLRRTIEEGQKVVREEFLRFAARAEGRYTALLRILKGGASWEKIKQGVPMSDSQLHTMLKRLIHCGFAEKRDRLYFIADPLLEEAV